MSYGDLIAGLGNYGLERQKRQDDQEYYRGILQSFKDGQSSGAWTPNWGSNIPIPPIGTGGGDGGGGGGGGIGNGLLKVAGYMANRPAATAAGPAAAPGGALAGGGGDMDMGLDAASALGGAGSAAAGGWLDSL